MDDYLGWWVSVSVYEPFQYGNGEGGGEDISLFNGAGIGNEWGDVYLGGGFGMGADMGTARGGGGGPFWGFDGGVNEYAYRGF